MFWISCAVTKPKLGLSLGTKVKILLHHSHRFALHSSGVGRYWSGKVEYWCFLAFFLFLLCSDPLWAAVLYSTADINIAGKFDSNILVAGFGETLHYKASVFENNPRTLVARNSQALWLCVLHGSSVHSATASKHCKTFYHIRSSTSSFHTASECSELLWWPADLVDNCAGNCWHTNRKFPRLMVWVWWLYRLDIRILRHQRDEQPSSSDIVNRMRGNTAEFWASEETRSRLSKILETCLSKLVFFLFICPRDIRYTDTSLLSKWRSISRVHTQNCC